MTQMTAYNLRRHRDRLVDLLAIGETFPLQDTPLPEKSVLVGFGEPARLPIEHSQHDVRYTLYFEESPVTRQAGQRRRKVEALGNGDTVFLETDPIEDDITFSVWATKTLSGRQSRLHQRIRVQVGLDTRLHAFIRDLPELAPSPLAPSPRLARFGQPVEVELVASQEGIDYDLVVLEPQGDGNPPTTRVISVETVRGNRQNRILRLEAAVRDIDIRLRATRSAVRGEELIVIEDILDVILPLRVRASQAPVVTARPAIAAYGAPAALHLDQAEPDVTYRLFARPLVDGDYAHGAPAAAGVVVASVPEAEPVPVRFPAAGIEWQTPAGFTPLGEPQSGAASLEFPIPPLTRDTLVLIQGQKTHALNLLPLLAADPGPSPAAAVSLTQLANPALFLVQPNPRPALTLAARPDEETFELRGGEPGTFIRFLDENERETAPRLYFYEADEMVVRYFKGVNRFQVGINLVIDGTRDRSAGEQDLTQTTRQLLQLPRPLFETRTLLLEAIRARTRTSTRLAEPLMLAPPVTIAPEAPFVPFGGETKIRITQSRADEYYQLQRDGLPLAEPAKGIGRDRLLPTGPLEVTTTLILHVTQPAATWPVERWLPVTVEVLPEADIPFTIQSAGGPGVPVQIQLQRSAVGVLYQIWRGDQPFGEPATGSGEPLLVSSRPLEGPLDSPLMVRAVLAANPALAVTFFQPIEGEQPG